MCLSEGISWSVILVICPKRYSSFSGPSGVSSSSLVTMNRGWGSSSGESNGASSSWRDRASAAPF